MRHFRSVPPTCQIVPREIAELRAIFITSKIDPKKHKTVSVADIAPWTLFHHERDREPVDPRAITDAIKTIAPQSGRIKFEDLRKSDG